MASGSTSRLAIPYPVGTDPTNVPGDVQSLATRLDGITFEYQAGTAGGRPSPGTPGRMYYATDTGGFSFDNGSAWLDFGNSVPIGGTLVWPGPETTIPSNYLLADGSSYSTTTYNVLYLALGGAASVWGTGSGTFNVPDLRATVPIGVTNTPRAGRGSYALGSVTGNETTTLTTSQMPLHNHADSGHAHPTNDPGHGHQTYLQGFGTGYQMVFTTPGPAGNSIPAGGSGLQVSFSAIDSIANSATGVGVGIGNANNQPAGGGSPTPILQPSTAVNWVIRAL